MATLIVAEPPPAYRVRTPLVVDASVLCALLFQEPERDQAAARLAGHDLHAPALLDDELINVAVAKARAGQAEIASDALERLPTVPLTLVAPQPLPVYNLAHRYGLSAYDAAYLWLAGELKAPLATFDRRLGEAAQRHLGSLGD